MRCVLKAIWFDWVPDGMNKAASFPKRHAMWFSNALERVIHNQILHDNSKPTLSTAQSKRRHPTLHLLHRQTFLPLELDIEVKPQWSDMIEERSTGHSISWSPSLSHEWRQGLMEHIQMKVRVISLRLEALSTLRVWEKISTLTSSIIFWRASVDIALFGYDQR